MRHTTANPAQLGFDSWLAKADEDNDRFRFLKTVEHLPNTWAKALPYYRALIKRYRGRPAAADMAFCIAAFSQGMPEKEMAAALTHEYLSRDKDQTRQAAYVRRTMAKAFRWVA